MNKMTKGALAAVVGAALLTGGVGTLAYWTASDDADGGSIASGEMTLTSSDCDDSWVYADGAAGAGQPVTAFVPGDIVTTTCAFTIGWEGDNLEATLSAPDTLTFTTDPAGTTFDATVDATYVLGATPLADGAAITNDNVAEDLTVSFVVTIPFGDTETVNTNDTQNILATLDTLTVELTQVNPNA